MDFITMCVAVASFVCGMIFHAYLVGRNGYYPSVYDKEN